MRTLRSDGPDNLSRATQQAQAEVEPGLSFVVRLSRAEAIGKLFCYQFRKKITDWGSVVVLGSMKLYQGFPNHSSLTILQNGNRKSFNLAIVE